MTTIFQKCNSFLLLEGRLKTLFFVYNFKSAKHKAFEWPVPGLLILNKINMDPPIQMTKINGYILQVSATILMGGKHDSLFVG